MEFHKTKEMNVMDFFMKKDWSIYAGQWVAICENKVVSSNKDLKKLLKDSNKKCKDHPPTFTKIPDKDSALLL